MIYGVMESVQECCPNCSIQEMKVYSYTSFCAYRCTPMLAGEFTACARIWGLISLPYLEPYADCCFEL